MPDLFHSLQGRDLGHLRIVAGLWGIELSAPDAHAALPLLARQMLDQRLVGEMVEAMPDDTRDALRGLLDGEGRMPWSLFTRRYGALREMGPARRDRQRPHLSPASPTEYLWYRGFIARAFLKSKGSDEPQEFAYIPDELLDLLPDRRGSQEGPPGRAASPGESAEPRLASDRIVDHACTLLAALRLGLPLEKAAWHQGWHIPPHLLQPLLAGAGLLDAGGVPLAEPARTFLAQGRGQALAQLAAAWLNGAYNDLRLLPGLSCEGEWRNDPLKARQALLELLSEVPLDTWWSLPAFVAAVRERRPDFQRTAGDYDAWYIKDTSSGEYLRGSEHWEQVEGALIRFIITGPLHWCGMLDLAAPAEDAPPSAFRFSAWSAQLMHGGAPALAEEDDPIHVGSDARLRLSARVPRALRYQVARFCRWDAESSSEYRYRITAASLERARAQQGLRPGQLLALLRRHASAPLHPMLVHALERWEQNGTQAVVERVYILRVTSAEIMQALRKAPAARFLGDPLSATTIIVKESALDKVLNALAEMGYLTDVSFENEAEA